MGTQALSIRLTLRLTLAVLLVVFGTTVLVGAFDPLNNTIWLPLVTLLAGVFILTPDSHNNTLVGLVLTGVGGFMLLREAGVINTPWLSYLLGGFCVLTGTVNIMRNATGKEVRLFETFAKTNTDKQHKHHEGA